MKTYISLAVIIIASALSLYAENIEIVSRTDRIEVNIKNLDFETVGFSDGLSRIILNGNYTAPIRNIGNFPMPELVFPFAVKKFVETSININSIKLKYLGNLKLAGYSDVYPSDPQFRFPEKTKDKIKHEIALTKGGSSRGINFADLRVQPLSYDALSGELYIIESAEIEIIFRDPIDLMPVKDFSEYDFFQFVCNKPHLQYLFDLAKRNRIKKSDELLSEENWYKPEIQYYKLSTKKHGIAYLSFTELLALDNSLKGKSSENLHLIWRGKEYPYYISGDGTIEDGGGIFFLGREARGDTTWYDNFTFYEVFFLFYDESAKGMKMPKFIPAESAQTQITEVAINKRIEKEKVYFLGKFPEWMEESYLEGWYWQLLNPLIGPADQYYGHARSFSHLEWLSPAYSDSIEIKVHYNGLSDKYYNDKDSLIEPYYNLKLVFNGDTVASKVSYEMAPEVLSAKLSSDVAIQGLNRIEVYPFTDEKRRIGISGVDYITISGREKPTAYLGNTSFPLTTGNANEELSINGFSSGQIWGVDTIGGEFVIADDIKSQRGVYVSAGVKSGAKAYMSFRVGDTARYSADKGILVAYAPQNEFSRPVISYFPTFNTELENLIKAIPSGSLVSVIINIDAGGQPNRVPKYFADYFSAMGSAVMSGGEIPTGSGWCFAGVQGNPGAVYESDKGFVGFIPHIAGSSYIGKIPLNSDRTYSFIFNDETAIERIIPEAVLKTNYHNTDLQADGIIIYNKKFENAVMRLKAHRESQNLKIITVEVNDLFKEFDFGRNSPYAIKSFMKHALRKWREPAPRFLLLFGDACWDARKAMDVTISENFVPVYGNPVSDYWYSYFDSANGLKPEIHVGRIPANTVDQAESFVDKLIYYDTIPMRPWMKNFFFISGGGFKLQRDYFSALSKEHAEFVNSAPLCADSTLVRKYDEAVGSEKEAGRIREIINAGAGWTNFLGHASAEVFDIDGWQANKLNNSGRYGVLSTLSCNAGAYGEPQLIFSRNEAYMMEKNRGFVASIGSSTTGFVNEHNYMFMRILEAVGYPNIAFRYLGQILNFGKSFLYAGDINQFLTIHHVLLLGDPMTKLRIGVEPDLYLLDNDISITTSSGSSSPTEADSSVKIAGVVYNYGYKNYHEVEIAVIRECEGSRDTLWLTFDGVCKAENFEFSLPILNMPGVHNLTIAIDPLNKTEDPNRENNSIKRTLHIFKTGLLPLDPLTNWDARTESPVFRVINPFAGNDEFEYSFALFDSFSPSAEPILVSSDSQISETEAYIDWSPNITLENDKSYLLKAKLINKTQGNLESGWLTIPFFANKNYQSEKTVWNQSGKPFLEQNRLNELIIDTSGNFDKIVLKSKDYNFKLVSVGGGFRGSSPHKRWVNIEVEKDVFADTYENRGFNVLAIPMNDNSNKGRLRNYDTWWDSSSSRRMVQFLRDSVNEDEYVLIAISDQAFRIPAIVKISGRHPDKTGSIDTLRAVLREFGSALAEQMTGPFHDDSLDWGYSFVMLGRKGYAPGSAREKIHLKGDSVELTGSFRRYYSSGKLESPLLGPATEWDNVTVSGKFEEGVSSAGITLHGYKKDGSIPYLIGNYKLNETIDLNGLPAGQKPVYLRVSAELGRIKFEEEPYISEISAKFAPSPEMAVLKKKSGLESDVLLRGEETNLKITLKNISPRVSAKSSDLTLLLTNRQGEQDITRFDFENLAQSKEREFYKVINTTDLDRQTRIISEVNLSEKSFTELYKFNNHSEYLISVIEDTIKPVLVLKLDGIVPKQNGFTSIQPKVEVELYDNSPLKITSQSKINVRILKYQTPQNTREWKFESFSGQELKARLSFIPDSFDYGENSIWVFGEDAAGNRDTLHLLINVSLNSFITDLRAVPNPTSSRADIKFYYYAATLGAKANIEIFNIEGRKVRSLDKDIIIGENSIAWDGAGDNGTIQPPGIYVFRLWVDSEYYTDPYFGKIIRIN